MIKEVKIRIYYNLVREVISIIKEVDIGVRGLVGG